MLDLSKMQTNSWRQKENELYEIVHYLALVLSYNTSCRVNGCQIQLFVFADESRDSYEKLTHVDQFFW